MAPACLEDTPRMLVIDDEPAIQGALQRFFARRGWVVDCASHGLEALARIEARLDAGERFALILCDLRMPTMSGLELHDVLASRHPEVLERVVFLSGDLVSEDVREFIDRTSCRIFIKPLDVSALQRAADDALRASASAGNTRRPEVARAS